MSRRVSNPKLGAVPKQPQPAARRGSSRPGSAGPSRPSSAGARPTSAGAKTTPAKTPTSKATPIRSGQKPKAPACPAAAAKFKKEQAEVLTPVVKAYENPAFSIPLKKIQTNPLLADKDKKKAIRRNIPPGEDLPGIKKILGSLKNQEINVAEFLSLIAPSTGDNGEVMRSVLIEDMNSFRSLSRKIYNTMTQDISDVLTNQHIQMKEFEQEKTTQYTEKMMRAINEIYSYASKFDFEDYYRNPKGYLDLLFPIPVQIEAHSEEAEMCRRQQMYHRLNWLKTEGQRLSSENNHLQSRLAELKREQKEEMILAEQREAEAEVKREELRQQELEAQQQLVELTDTVEKTMIDTEASIRITTDEANMNAPVQKKTGAIRKTTTAKTKKKSKKEWVVEAAAEVEVQGVEETMIAESSSVDTKSESLAGAIRKARAKAATMRRQRPKTPEREGEGAAGGFHFSPIKTPPSKPPPSKERSPFHFSPIKTPPQKTQARKPPSPFHFSPIKTPPQKTNVQKPPSPFHFSPIKEPAQPQERTYARYMSDEQFAALERMIGKAPPTEMQTTTSAPPSAPTQMQTTRLRTEKVTVQERATTSASSSSVRQTRAPAAPTTRAPAATRGRQYAPRDTWGGFG